MGKSGGKKKKTHIRMASKSVGKDVKALQSWEELHGFMHPKASGTWKSADEATELEKERVSDVFEKLWVAGPHDDFLELQLLQYCAPLLNLKVSQDPTEMVNTYDAVFGDSGITFTRVSDPDDDLTKGDEKLMQAATKGGDVLVNLKASK